MDPIACPKCGDFDWTQKQHYHATDSHWIVWREETRDYHFSYETENTSNEETLEWECFNGHVGDDWIQEAIERHELGSLAI